METAGPDRMVQVAIVYRGPKISLYHDGQLAAEYKTERAHVFRPPMRVAIGVRHLPPFGLPPARIGGQIEEARIYDRALSSDELARLKPGTPSAIKPVAQWSFEDGTARDEMGFFANGKLHGGAKISGGKLLLDGTDGYLSAGAEDYTSAVPRRASYAVTLPEQIEQLETCPGRIDGTSWPRRRWSAACSRRAPVRRDRSCRRRVNHGRVRRASLTPAAAVRRTRV